MPVRPDFIAEVPAWTQDWFTIFAQESHVTGISSELSIRIQHPIYHNLKATGTFHITVTPCEISSVDFATPLQDMTYIFGQGPVT